jgi:hypothetical protein
MSDYIKELNEIYEQYEKVLKVIAEQRTFAKEMKNAMIEIMNDNGVDTAVVSGLEEDAVELVIEMAEREVINKKDLATEIGVKQKDLSKLEQWIILVNEGKLTSEILEQFKFTEESEKFSVKPYRPNSEED